MPVLVVVLFTTGLATMVEAAAVAFGYAIFVECFITRDIHPFRGLPEVLIKASILCGSVPILLANVVLLVLGSVLEIYSAIIILAPLVAPLGVAFGIDPVHLGVIFLANLELGFLFPPAGLNLFLASSRFGKPLPQLYRHVVPFLIILGLGVLAITYFPQMSTGILRLLGK